MPYISNTQKRTAKQSIQNRFIKIEVLNYNFDVIGSVEGVATAGTITIDSESDTRRTASLTMVVKDNTLAVGPNNIIWLDKYLRLLVGTKMLPSGDFSWDNCGIYLIDAPSYSYDNVNNSLNVTLLDLMSKTTGVRNGYLEGKPVLIKAGELIRDVFIAVLKLGGFNDYIINDPPEPGVIPFDMEFGQGSTIYDILQGLLTLYPDYEMFFDINGTFIYQKIPDSADEQVAIDDDIFNNVLISETYTVDLQNVKNSIEVYGRTHNPVYFSAKTSVSGNLIALEIPEVQEYEENIIYGFTIKNPIGYKSVALKINNLKPYAVKLDDGKTDVVIAKEQGEIYYCVQYKKGYWNWLGHLQAYAIAEDTNPKSPYYIKGTIGKIRLPLYGDEYDNVFSDDLARQRAERELYNHTKLLNTVELTCVPIYWADVNTVVEYTPKQEKSRQNYMIKNISMGLAPTDTMTITMVKI